MAWDEVQELIEYGALKESEVKTVWNVSCNRNFQNHFIVFCAPFFHSSNDENCVSQHLTECPSMDVLHAFRNHLTACIVPVHCPSWPSSSDPRAPVQVDSVGGHPHITLGKYKQL